MGEPGGTREVISFGPFRLAVSERLLTRGGARVDLGGRTLDMLVALVSRPNEVVSKKELLEAVWPDVTVEESSLRFHIAGVRKALGDGKDGARYIATLASRGYCFVAPVTRTSGHNPANSTANLPRANLPDRLQRMIGRVDSVLMLTTQLSATRFVTIVGAGGVGKTTVAVAVGHELSERFGGAVLFVDLGALSDPKLVATSIASMLGLPVQTDDPVPSLIAFLRHKRILLILDTCEHLIEAAASLAGRIFAATPQVHILATSREVLRAEGEHVYRLAPLAVPPEDAGLSAVETLQYPATQLFVERALASGARLDPNDANAGTIAHICRQLDGLPLAIELAAGRVEAYGLQETASLLEQRLTLLWQGQRTAPPRQKTLQATLDWSFGLLSELERMVLGQLAVFVGYFTIEAALAVVTNGAADAKLVFGTIDSLVAKSMVAARPVGAMMRYRLLDTTRAYALELSADHSGLAARHAVYYRQWIERTGLDWPTLSSAAERAPHLAGLGNVRAALEWCFGSDGNEEIGIGLAAAAAPVFMAMSLLTECHRWSERAILALDEAMRGGREEMRLQAGLAMSLMFTRGESETALAALNRALAIAEARGDALDQLQLLGPLHMFHLRIGDVNTALRHAQRSATISTMLEGGTAISLPHSLLGIALHLAGDLGDARRELEAAIQHGPGAQRTRALYLGFDHHNWASIALARTLWLQGYPVQAAGRARQSVSEAAGMDHPVTLSIALNWAVSVFFWIGDLQSAEEYINRFISHAEYHSMGPYLAVGRGFRGELAIRRGDAENGIESVRGCLAQLHVARYELLTTAFELALVRGLAALRRVAEGMVAIDATISRVEANGDLSYMPELLRVRAGLLLSQSRWEDAAAELRRSLDLSRRQGACAWELRTATDLAALWAAQGRQADARTLLRPIFDRFVEGSDTSDLQAADRLLATLG